MKNIFRCRRPPEFHEDRLFIHAIHVHNSAADAASVLVGDTLAMGRCPTRPKFWDGHTAKRIVTEMLK